MIEAHELDEQLITPDYTSQRIFEDNQTMFAWLGRIHKELLNLRRSIGLQEPRPSIVTLPLNGSATRFMCETLTVAVAQACSVQLFTGSVAERTWQFGAADTKVFDYPLVIEPGKDYSLVASTGTVTGYFTGYTETLFESW